ncbi:MAG: hypothetical protein AAGA48_04745 [Myxococcota bacterium]
MWWGLLGVGWLAGCRGVCTADDEGLRIGGRDADDPVVERLQAVWADFTEAVAPARVCVGRIRVRENPARFGGRYRAVLRDVRITEDDADWQVTTLRHEMCHAWDLQVLDGPPPDAVFPFDPSTVEDYRGNEAREAFAWTCSLEPALVEAVASAPCGDVGDDALTWVASAVYTGLEPVKPFEVDRVDLNVPGLRNPVPYERLTLTSHDGDRIEVVVDIGESTERRLWLDTRQGRVTEGPPPSVVPREPPPPPDEGEKPNDALWFSIRPAWTDGHVTVSQGDVELLSGDVPRILRREGDGPWQAVAGVCDLPTSPRTAFTLDATGRLMSVSVLEDNGLAIVYW